MRTESGCAVPSRSGSDPLREAIFAKEGPPHVLDLLVQPTDVAEVLMAVLALPTCQGT
jgi:hypothetical protein